MKKGCLGRKSLALLLVFMSLMPLSVSAQEVPSSRLVELLNKIPILSFESGWLSYADYELVTEYSGVTLPFSLQDEQSLDGEQAEALLNAFLNISAGPTDVLLCLPQAQAMLSACGVDFYSIRQALETGMSPARQLWLAGSFDAESIDKALLQKGYLPLVTPDSLRQTWASGGDITAGNRIDFSKRDTAFPFGGNIGQSWPITLLPGILASTPDAIGAQAIAQGDTPTLAEDTGLISGVDALLQQGEIAQMYALTPKYGGLIVTDDHGLPHYELILLAHVYTGESQYVYVALVYADASAAKIALKMLADRLAENVMLSAGESLQSLVSQRGGEAETPVLLESIGYPVLLIPFRFPMQNLTVSELSYYSPFRLFSYMFLRRDLGWLGTAE